jgi:hypothetical protein
MSLPSAAGSVVVQHLGINGNRGNYPNGNSNATDARCTNWCLGISVANLDYYETNDVEIYDAPTYASLSSNIVREVHRAGRFIAPSLAVNTDGVHKDGPFGTYAIDNMYLSTGDDAIALNLPEGYGGNGGAGTISNIVLANSMACLRAYTYSGSGSGYNLAPITVNNMIGSTFSDCFRLGFNVAGAHAADEINALIVNNVTVSPGGYFVNVAANVGAIQISNSVWDAPAAALPWIGFTSGATVSNYTCTACQIYRNTSGSSAAYWGLITSGSTIKRMEIGGASVANEQGQSYAAIPYAFDVQSGGSVGTFVMNAMDPALTTSLLNGSQWSRIGSFYGPGVAGYFRNTTYAKLPPPGFTGLSVSISDSAAGGVWGATESGGSPGHYAQLNSNGTNWTVTGK